MVQNKQGDIDILLSVVQGQRQESIQHRQTILNLFSLSIAGLMVILGGVISANKLSCELIWIIGIGIGTICICIPLFICQQRKESDKGMEVMRTIEKHLKLYKENSFIPGKSILPGSFANEKRGLTTADYFQTFTIIFLGLIIILAIICKV